MLVICLQSLFLKNSYVNVNDNFTDFFKELEFVTRICIAEETKRFVTASAKNKNNVI